MLSTNTILRERYRIINQLGNGGMGAVYQAMDENLNCLVAVKETFAANDEQRRAFRREAELLANLTHVALPRVMDHFTHDQGQFLVMQYVPGHDLAELLALREQPFSVAKVLGWADQLLDALEELHSSDPPIVHRDIKPANLKVTPKGKVLLLDFGLAKGFAGQMSTADVESHGKSIYGYTPHYAPLEQIRGVGTDPRSDLYSLAATLWTLLTCQVPPDALSRVAEKEDGNPDPLRSAHEINPQVPLALSNLLNRAMTLNRNQRPTTAGDLRNALSELTQTEFERPTLSQPPPTSLPEVLPTPDATPDSPESVPKSSVQPESIPTMWVNAPPVVPSWEPGVVTSNSMADEPAKESKFQKRLTLVVAGIFIITISMTVATWRGWLPWAESDQAVQVSASPSNPTPPAGMAYVPGGNFTMGRNASDNGDEYEHPAHRVAVKPFFIDVHEVTNRNYKECVDARRCRRPEGWNSDTFDAFTALHPVTGVTWEAANAYAKWAGKRLPTEEEWEFAARGTDGRLYPWGSVWQQGRANVNGEHTGTVEVGVYQATSPFGALDMVGNVWEWTASRLMVYPGGAFAEQPSGDVRVIRGGSYAEALKEATVTYRGFLKVSGDKYDKTGFRCAKDAG